jgi:hypothetical protein
MTQQSIKKLGEKESVNRFVGFFTLISNGSVLKTKINTD